MINNTNRRTFMASVAAGLAATGCANMPGGAGWSTLVDGPTMTNLNGFTELGAGGWTIEGGVLQGKGGKLGYLVTKDSYTDFEIRAEFWADEDCNSGLFMRCQDRNKVGTAAVVSNDILFQNKILGTTVNGTTYCGIRARTTGTFFESTFIIN